MRKIQITHGLLILLTCLFCLSSCSKNEELQEVALEVNSNNISGTWQLTEWNGAQLPEGSYCYLILERRDKKFKLYQKIDSMYGRYITGTYELETDPYLGSIISGDYDYGAGDWNNSYIVTNLMPSGTMTWTVKGNSDDVTLFRKCSDVPADVIADCGQ